MDFFQLINERASIRSYKDRAISDEQLEKLLEASRSAPSAGNLQAYEILVVKDEEEKKELAQAAQDQNFVAQAPVVLVFLQDRERSKSRYGERGELYSLQDATIAVAYMQLAAVEMNLGSCWVGAFDEDQVAQSLQLEKRPIALLPIGYPANHPSKTSRRALGDFVRYR